MIKNLGSAYPMTCPKCANPVYFEFYKHRRWFWLFFIPIYLGKRYYLVCPICELTVTVPKSSAVNFRKLTEATDRLFSRDIDATEYLDILRPIDEAVDMERDYDHLHSEYAALLSDSESTDDNSPPDPTFQ